MNWCGKNRLTIRGSNRCYANLDQGPLEMDKKNISSNSKIYRRGFLTQTAAAAATCAILAGGLNKTEAKRPAKKFDVINVGLIGAGSQGQVLLNSCLISGQDIPGLHFKAVCDIWKFRRDQSVRTLNAYNRVKKHDKVKEFTDYREMLAQKDQLDLDAVIIATPDWMHAEQAIAAMNAGLHVYCEKEMSNSLELARQMVLTSQETRKLLQIGRQRRSNPRYLAAINTLVLENKLLGRVMQGNAQWNRAVSADIGWPARHALSAKELVKYGYDTMRHFRNWRWFKRYSGGPVVDLGAHQIDVFNWVFGGGPKSVIASGGCDYYKNHQWYDNVMCTFEYETDEGVARAFYQVQTTTRHGGFYETFMGEHGSLIISEVPRYGNRAEKEIGSPDWEKFIKPGLLNQVPRPKMLMSHSVLDARCDPSDLMYKWPLRTELGTLPHQPHLKNFFDTIRGKATLNCPGQLAYQTAATVLAINEAVKSEKKIKFTKKDFEIKA